ncbi:MAG: PaaI family thioesterase [Clostridiales bacterium]|nr:PaaI family thioesterase [Clostridiales bacterium]
MKDHVTGRQFVTALCFGCGQDNPIGLKGRFYNLESGKIAALFYLGDEFQGYPQRLHGGITASILDESLGRAIVIPEPDCWAVTAELTIRYKKPVPLHTPLKVIAEVTDNNRRLFHSKGTLILPDGEIAATATGTYMKQSLSQIADTEGLDMDNIRIWPARDEDFIEY